MTSLLFLVLSQVVTPVTAAPTPDTVFSWSDGRRVQWLTQSATLVAEPAPTEATKAALLRLAPTATVFVATPTVRLWRVENPGALLAKLPALVPAFHDGKTGVGRVRVPLGLVCEGQLTPASWREVFSRSGAKCLPNFWYPPVRK